jgi:hypothetical protein
MTSPWTVKATTERVDLDPTGRAEATFTVTNNGPVDQRLVFDVVPGDGASRDWFDTATPQVLVTHGGSAPVLVSIAVPAGTAAGPLWFAGRAYSADRAPEETSVLSDRVAFEVEPSARPQPWWRRWWWVFAVAALVLVVVAVVLFLVLRKDQPPDGGVKVPTVVRRAGAVTFNPSALIDLDEIILGGPDPANDLRYLVRPGRGWIEPRNDARLAKIGPTDRPAEACTKATLSTDDIPVSEWQVGEVLCVRTNSGRLSVVILNQKISPTVTPSQPSVVGTATILPPKPPALTVVPLPPQQPQLQVSITTFEPTGDEQ